VIDILNMPYDVCYHLANLELKTLLVLGKKTKIVLRGKLNHML
jgi:hypothetical protein